MNGDVSIPPFRDLPPDRLAQRREHLISEIAQPRSRSRSHGVGCWRARRSSPLP